MDTRLRGSNCKAPVCRQNDGDVEKDVDAGIENNFDVSGKSEAERRSKSKKCRMEFTVRLHPL